MLARTAAPQQHHVRIGKRPGGGIGGAKIGQHALIRREQAFGHGKLEILAQPFGQQQSGNAIRRVRRAGEHQQPVMCAQRLGQGVEAMPGRTAGLPFPRIRRVNRDDARLLPRQPDAGACQLQRGEVRQHLER